MFSSSQVSHNKSKIISSYTESMGKKELGATLVEYMLLVSLIAITALVAVQAAGRPVSALYDHIVDEVVPALSGQ
jgi:Flp pilus assembly pilin Flp